MVIMVILVIYAGFLYIIALAASERISAGRAVLTYLIIPMVFGGCAILLALANSGG
jgi:hypothetical protein